MAKRLTDTEKYKDPWFCELTPALKALYLYMVDTCDCAGVWKASFKMFKVHWGFDLKHSDMDVFGYRVVRISEENYLLINFIKFQYGELHPKSNVLKGILKSLNYNNIQMKGIPSLEQHLPKGYDTLLDKDMAMAMDKGNGIKNKSASNNAPNPDYLFNLWNSKAPSLGLPYAEYFFTYKNAQDFQEISKCLELAKKTWEEYFEKIFKSEFLTKKKTGGALSFSWALNPDNFSKVMNGAFDEKEMSDEEAMAVLYNNRGF